MRPIVRNTKPITANTETMFQWMMRPTTRFATTATANTSTTAIAANNTEPAQLRGFSSSAFDLDAGLDFDLEFLFAFVLARAPLHFA